MILQVIIVGLISILISSCSGNLSTINSQLYEEFRTIIARNLQIPPKAITQEANNNIASKIMHINIIRNNNKRWLIIKNYIPSNIWNIIKEYWNNHMNVGTVFIEQNPNTGIMKTRWIKGHHNIKTNSTSNIIQGIFSNNHYLNWKNRQFLISFQHNPIMEETKVYLTCLLIKEGIKSTNLGLEAIILHDLMIYIDNIVS